MGEAVDFSLDRLRTELARMAKKSNLVSFKLLGKKGTSQNGMGEKIGIRLNSKKARCYSVQNRLPARYLQGYS